jgi:hypothetical protein
MSKCLDVVDGCVTSDMNANLTRTFTVEEVSEALNQMSSLKAARLDGFSAGFYQNNWAVVGMEVSKIAIDFLNAGYLNKELNSTYIALIPKIEIPQLFRIFALLAFLMFCTNWCPRF